MIDWVSAFGILMRKVKREEQTKSSCVNAFCIAIQKLGSKYASQKSLEKSYNYFALFYSNEIDCRIMLDD
jgi:hypothetical protein